MLVLLGAQEKEDAKQRQKEEKEEAKARAKEEEAKAKEVRAGSVPVRTDGNGVVGLLRAQHGRGCPVTVAITSALPDACDTVRPTIYPPNCSLPQAKRLAEEEARRKAKEVKTAAKEAAKAGFASSTGLKKSQNLMDVSADAAGGGGRVWGGGAGWARHLHGLQDRGSPSLPLFVPVSMNHSTRCTCVLSVPYPADLLQAQRIQARRRRRGRPGARH